MTFKKVEETGDKLGIDWIVDGELCRKICLEDEIDISRRYTGEYLLPYDYFPTYAYKIMQSLGAKKFASYSRVDFLRMSQIEKYIHRLKKIAMRVTEKSLLRDLCLQRYYDGVESFPDDIEIESHYAKI